ncbi:MAG: hypothetical protein SOW59_04975 [Corynebacterium sp.]|nr:hypothetical protein [Corynebacterium sp.]
MNQQNKRQDISDYGKSVRHEVSSEARGGQLERSTVRPSAPQTVKIAAAIVAVQALCAMCFGLFLIYRDVTGAENPSMITESSTALHVGTGTAVFIFIIFGFVIAGAWSMVNGKRWGHGGVVLVQFILVAISFQMKSGGSPVIGVLILASAAIALYLILVAQASRAWFEATF